jgi:hypothetical protein
MSLENTIHNAYLESVTGVRRGDTIAEQEEVRNSIIRAKKIVVPNHNDDKVNVINEVLKAFGLSSAVHLQIHTDCCDVSRMPAITKAFLALDVTDADLVIARGRLGVPGSGSMLVILDGKGRILSAALAPSHMMHGKSIAEAVRDEMRIALERIGLKARCETECM